MPTRERFEFALSNVKPSQWELFEQLASSFLASEYPNLRTMATPSGDGGRDSELFSEDGAPSVAFQYSVTGAWKAKIDATAERLSKKFPEIRVLRYITSASIGAKADDIKARHMKKGLIVDICDQSWFLDRASIDANRSNSAERFCEFIVDPILAKSKVIDTSPIGLSGDELSVSLFYLDMQRADDTAGKNLTRSCYEALVKAALSGTSPENTMSRDEIYNRVLRFLPRYELSQISRFIDNALTRLRRKEIGFYKKSDSFCLNYQTIERIKDLASERLVVKAKFESEVLDVISSRQSFGAINAQDAVASTFNIIDAYFLKQGERFASDISRGEISETPAAAIEHVVGECIGSHLYKNKRLADCYANLVHDILSAPSPAAFKYLQSRANSYTLLSFLSEVPDVQSATNKLFSSGSIWLDTTVLLPLIPESSAKAGEKPFSELFRRAKKAGITLKVTRGVIEEIERHLNKCRVYSKSQTWTGYVPYVFQRYVLQGGSRDHFSSWLEKFVGNYRPEDDIANFIEEFSIDVVEPERSAGLPEDLISAIQNYWQNVHTRRRAEDEFNLQANRLAAHDSENVISVLSERRRESGREGLGFRSWWLTLDGAAYRMQNDSEVVSAGRNFKSPIMSLDFLLKYLAFGPARDVVYSSENDSVRIFAPEIFDNIPPDLMMVAENIRQDLADLDMHIIKRRVRDGLDEARERTGISHKVSLEEIDSAMDEYF
ncbi:hypothetical protein JMM61_19700 [Rhodovulum sulfidophilum]|uniref:hypothetical protein n=1 Tax=Rhodovulum sulfidophilum TaxID=35806 RepID=UPI0019291A67|nr:hypothetical protein [Rhodovulum sulfidophilum]MBL3587558.1 hypothetical protein [Rhodovulum sulfidophilum]